MPEPILIELPHPAEIDGTPDEVAAAAVENLLALIRATQSYAGAATRQVRNAALTPLYQGKNTLSQEEADGAWSEVPAAGACARTGGALDAAEAAARGLHDTVVKWS